MKFNKDNFIARYSQRVFMMLKDFLYSENEDILRDLQFLLMNENLKMFEYEGNKYTIQKSLYESMIVIIDEISETNGVSQTYSRFALDVSEFLVILTEADKIIAESKPNG